MTRTTTLDTTSMAKVLLITPQHVRKLTGRGVLARARDVDGTELMGRYELIANVHAYIKYLRELARLDDASQSRYELLRNEKMASESAMAQIALKKAKGQVLKTSAVEFVMTNLITATKAHMLAIPSRVARLLVGVTSFQVIYDLIYTEIEMALRELSQWQPGMFSVHNAAWLATQGATPALLRSNGQADDENTGETDSA
jgi:phage terminase Nu1 subunit (DNA packaging protein)